MRTTVTTLIAAIALGIVAALGVFLYTAQADDRARSAQQSVDVVTTSSQIPIGTTLEEAWSQGLVQRTQVPLANAPSGVLAPEANRALVAQGTVPAGQIVLAAAFAEQAPVSEPIDLRPGEVAISVELGDPQRVGAFLRPGSSIAIFNTTIRLDQTSETRLLLFDVPVLAVGNATVDQSSEDQEAEAATSLVTIAVTASQAERVVHAAQTGALYLALLDADAESASTSGVTDSTLYVDSASQELP